MTTFDQLNLDSRIAKAISLCGYKTPTPIQAKSIPAILQGHDVIACAQTGTGKTASFVLPALHKISEKHSHSPRVLILTPTRELATQITQATSQYGKFLKFNLVSLVGGMPYRQQLRNLSRPVDVIVATPGRLMDHMDNQRLDLSKIEMLILDEADRMLDMGFIDDVKFIAQATPKARQTLLFSATVDNKLMQVIKQIQNDPMRIDVSPEKIAPAKIMQELYMADNHVHKSRLLMHFLKEQNIFKAIVFSATKINADQLAAELCVQGFEAAPLHGDLKQNARNKTLDRLRHGKLQILVATDVAARGIDINDITHVFNYDLPKFSEDYVHRIGRTGRAGKEGTAISFATHHDLIHVSRIERLLKQTLERKVVPGLEPSAKKTSGGGKKKHSGRSGERKFGGRGDFASRGERKTGERKFGDKDFASRGKKKFGDRKSSDGEFASHGKKRFDDRKSGDNEFAPRGKKKFDDRKSSDNQFAPRDKKRFDDRKLSDNEFAPRGKKRFNDRKSSDSEFAPRGKKRFDDRKSSDSEFAPRGKKRFDDRKSSDSEFAPRGKKRFDDRKSSDKEFAPRGERKFGDRKSADQRSAGRDDRRFGDKKVDRRNDTRKSFRTSESGKKFTPTQTAGRFSKKPARARASS